MTGDTGAAGLGVIKDWDPGAYDRFRGLRLRPALDLLAQVGALPGGPVIDLGCGSGAAGPVLATRWPGRVTGGDASPAMLDAARSTGVYAALELADIADWVPGRPAALIFSNAALHWLPDHAALMPRLAGMLAPGGTLAVQMPRQQDAPSHRIARDLAQAMFPACHAPPHVAAPVAGAAAYWRMLVSLGQVTAWETEYSQHLAPVVSGHPVRRFTESTLLCPILAGLSAAQQAAYLGAYDAALGNAYPALPDGGVLFPFRRCFFILTV